MADTYYGDEFPPLDMQGLSDPSDGNGDRNCEEGCCVGLAADADNPGPLGVAPASHPQGARSDCPISVISWQLWGEKYHIIVKLVSSRMNRAAGVGNGLRPGSPLGAVWFGKVWLGNKDPLRPTLGCGRVVKNRQGNLEQI